MRQPFLNDHRIDGTAVLPGVMGIEGFAEVARLLVPGRQVASVEDMEFLAPLKFCRDEPRTVTIRATLRRDGHDLLADCTLEAERVLPGSAAPQVTTHFTGKVRLSSSAPGPERDTAVAEPARTVASEDVYRLYFHGPAYQVVSSMWQQNGGTAARISGTLPDDHVPMTAPTITGPRLVELCFQTAGLGEAAQHGRLALPRHVDRVRILTDTTKVTGALYAVARESGEDFDCSVLDSDGNVVVRVEGYRTVALPGSVPDDVRAGLVTAPSELSRT
jgi:hypothetical protein